MTVSTSKKILYQGLYNVLSNVVPVPTPASPANLYVVIPSLRFNAFNAGAAAIVEATPAGSPALPPYNLILLEVPIDTPAAAVASARSVSSMQEMNQIFTLLYFSFRFCRCFVFLLFCSV